MTDEISRLKSWNERFEEMTNREKINAVLMPGTLAPSLATDEAHWLYGENITIFKLFTGEYIIERRGWSEEALLFACRHDGIIPMSLRRVEQATISDLRFAFFSQGDVFGYERTVRKWLVKGATGKHAPRAGTPEAQAIGPDDEHAEPTHQDPEAMAKELMGRGAPHGEIASALTAAFPDMARRTLGALLRGTPDDEDNKEGNLSKAKRALGLKR